HRAASRETGSRGAERHGPVARRASRPARDAAVAAGRAGPHLLASASVGRGGPAARSEPAPGAPPVLGGGARAAGPGGAERRAAPAPAGPGALVDERFRCNGPRPGRSGLPARGRARSRVGPPEGPARALAVAPGPAKGSPGAV